MEWKEKKKRSYEGFWRRTIKFANTKSNLPAQCLLRIRWALSTEYLQSAEMMTGEHCRTDAEQNNNQTYYDEKTDCCNTRKYISIATIRINSSIYSHAECFITKLHWFHKPTHVKVAKRNRSNSWWSNRLRHFLISDSRHFSHSFIRMQFQCSNARATYLFRVYEIGVNLNGISAKPSTMLIYLNHCCWLRIGEGQAQFVHGKNKQQGVNWREE